MPDAVQITKELKLGFDPNRQLITKLLEVIFEPAKKVGVKEWKDKFAKDDAYDHIGYLKSRAPRIPELNPQYTVNGIQAIEENSDSLDDRRKKKKNKYLPFKRKMLMIKDSMMANINASIRYYAPMLMSIQRTNKVQNLAHWYTFPRPNNNPVIGSDSDFQNMPSISNSPFAPWSIESEMVHAYDMFCLSQDHLTINGNSICFSIYDNEWTRVEISSHTIKNITFYQHPYYITFLFKTGSIQELIDASRSFPAVSDKHMRLATKKNSRDMIMVFTKNAATLEDVEKIKKVIGKDKVMMSNDTDESLDQLRQTFHFAPNVVRYLKRDGRLQWSDVFKEKYSIYLEKNSTKSSSNAKGSKMSTMLSAHVINKINKKNKYESMGQQKFEYKTEKSDKVHSNTASNIAASWMAANNEDNLQDAIPKNASKLIQNRSNGTPDDCFSESERKVKQLIKPKISNSCMQTDPISGEVNNNLTESESTGDVQKRKLSYTESDAKKLKLLENDSEKSLSNLELQKLLQKTVNSNDGSIQVVSLNNASGSKQKDINSSGKYIVLNNNNQDTNSILQKLNSGGLKLKPIVLPKNQKKHKLNSIMKNAYLKQLNKGLNNNNEAAQSHSNISKDERKTLMFCPKRSLSSIFSAFNYSPSATHHVKIHGSDLLCLNDGQYINDNIINFYLYYIYYELMCKEQRDRTHIFNVFFNTRLQGSSAYTCIDPPADRHARVATWTKKVDIFDKDYIIIPINEAQHWFLGIVCFPWMVGMISYDDLLGRNCDENSESLVIPKNDTKFATETRFERVGRLKDRYDIEPLPCILLFDSLQGQPRAANVRVIREYLKSEWESKRSQTDGPLVFDRNTIRGYNPKVPQQNNSVDCGLYLVHYVEMFFKNPLKNFTKDFFENHMLKWFDDEMINGKRAFIQNLIIRKADEKSERIVKGGYLAEPEDSGSQDDKYSDEDRLENVDESNEQLW